MLLKIVSLSVPDPRLAEWPPLGVFEGGDLCPSESVSAASAAAAGRDTVITCTIFVQQLL